LKGLCGLLWTLEKEFGILIGESLLVFLLPCGFLRGCGWLRGNGIKENNKVEEDNA
jgi:hypothetical protein